MGNTYCSAQDATDVSPSLKQMQHLVLVGPSGVGKGTLIDKLFADFPGAFMRKISYTTREPRQHEKDGVHYNFLSKEQFEKDINDDMFIEHALVHGNYYGTSVASLEAADKANKVLILELDVQGVQLLRQKKNIMQPLYVWIGPPCYKELRNRLIGRQTESNEQVEKRMKTAEVEKSLYDKNPELFDHTLINGDLSTCYHMFLELIVQTYPGLASTVNSRQKSSDEKN